MQTNRHRLSHAAIEVSITDSPAGLSDIHRSEVVSITWRRQLNPEFQGWVNQLDPAALPRARMILQPQAVRDAVKAICDGSGVPQGPGRKCLINEIAALTDVFAGLMSVQHLMLRLDVIAQDACSNLHIDTVSARPVCTYRDTGSQFGIRTDEADPQRVSVVPTDAPILLRGNFWPDQAPSGLLHRLPPIEGMGETRPVVELDPVPDPEEVL